ncbi:DinB family protein [Kribbella sp. NPDC023855]|uniref:DinB family protein n=1 Tax=Kribbella sp. NPDC023855 TaxID=3154698 RepID=UPI0033F3F10C
MTDNPGVFEEVTLREARFRSAELPGAQFERVDLSGAVLRNVDLSDAVLHSVDLGRALLRAVNLHGAELRGVELTDVRITGEVQNVTINGVDVAPLVEAELDRRDPDRVKMRPADPAGFREAWDLLERRWDETVERARALPPELLHESVNGEWSFIETLRHLAFATDSWVRRAILGDPSPWHPLDLPWDEMPDMPGVPRDRAARPSLDEALALRKDRMATVRRYVDHLTDDQLAGNTTPVTGASGWPHPISYPIHDCLSIVLNEEYQHRQYAERDLTALEKLHTP